MHIHRQKSVWEDGSLPKARSAPVGRFLSETESIGGEMGKRYEETDYPVGTDRIARRSRNRVRR